jgi:hypothetical protein
MSWYVIAILVFIHQDMLKNGLLFLCSWISVTLLVTIVPRHMPLLEQDLLTLPEHMS